MPRWAIAPARAPCRLGGPVRLLQCRDTVVGFDEYERKAQLTPGLLAVAPVAFVVAGVGWNKYPAVAIASGIIVAAGATYLLAVLVRHRGRRVERELWASWGGPPTTTMLRLRTPTQNATLRDSWRQGTETLTGITLLPLEEEDARPDEADQVIETAVRQLLHLGQCPEHPLVAKENIQYGFERNLYGTRWIGRGIAAASVATLTGILVFGPVRVAGTTVASDAVAAALVIDLAFLFAWLVLPSANRVHLAAERYANQLLQAAVVASRSA